MPDEQKLLTVHDIAAEIGCSASSVRSRLNKYVEENKNAIQEGWIDHGRGPVPTRYHPELIKRAVPAFTSHANSTSAETYIRQEFPRAIPVRLIGQKKSMYDTDTLLGILENRSMASGAYRALIERQIMTGGDLYVRCITGTDLFSSHAFAHDFFKKRVEKKLGPIKVLLLYPFGLAAEVRSSAEGEKILANSQFLRDSESSMHYLKANHTDLNIEPKWIDMVPNNQLIWTNGFALMEPYDLGAANRNTAECIGRHAPILVIRGDCNYHHILGDGFRYTFKGDPQTKIRTYSLEQVAKEFTRIRKF